VVQEVLLRNVLIALAAAALAPAYGGAQAVASERPLPPAKTGSPVDTQTVRELYPQGPQGRRALRESDTERGRGGAAGMVAVQRMYHRLALGQVRALSRSRQGCSFGDFRHA
jgi:hypothetical protein